MPLADQIRKYRTEQGISLSELARRSKISKGYLSQLEKKPFGRHPSADILYRIAFALGISIGTLLEKQIGNASEELTDVSEGLRNFAYAEQLTEEEIRMLARIEYRGRRPRTTDDWKFLYEAIKRSTQ